MVSTSDLHLWQTAVGGINDSGQTDLSQEEWSALSVLNNSLNSNDFSSIESIHSLALLKQNLPQHDTNRILQMHLKSFISLCDKYNSVGTAPVSNPPSEDKRSLSGKILLGASGQFKAVWSKNLKLAIIYLLVFTGFAGVIYALNTYANAPAYATALVVGALAGFLLLRKNQNGEIREKTAFLVAVVAGVWIYPKYGGQISGYTAFAWAFMGVSALCTMIFYKNKPNLFVWLAEVAPALLCFLAFERLGGAISGFGAKELQYGEYFSVRYTEAVKFALLFCLFQSFANNALAAQFRETVTSKGKTLMYYALPAVIILLFVCIMINPFKLPVFDRWQSNLISLSQPLHADAVVFNANGNKIGVAKKTPRSNALLSKHIPGYLATAYDFSYEGNFGKAMITFEYEAGLGKVGSKFQPRIYYFNESNGTLEELPNQDVKTNSFGKGWSSVTAMVEHFSTYILLNKYDYDIAWNKNEEIRKPQTDPCSCGSAAIATKQFKNFDVVFVIDESGSMKDNDPNNLRVEAAKQFIDLLAADSRNNRVSIYGFENSSRLISNLTVLKNKETVKTFLNTIHAGGGTNIYSGLSAAVKEIQTNNTSNYSPVIILMTDGQDNSNITNYTNLIAEANAKGITIFAIGLGKVDDKLLRQICDNTGGGVYYYAGNADELPFIFKSANAAIVDYVKDSNGDGISDYYAELLSNGTLRLSNGSKQFAGIDWVNCSADLDGDGLLNGEELFVKETVINGITQVVVTMRSDPTKKGGDIENIVSDSEDFKFNPDVYSQQLADTLALYAALAYDQTRIAPKSDVDYLLKIKPFPFPPLPNNEYFSHYLSKYTELKDRNEIVYFSGKRDDTYVGKGNNKPFVLIEQLKYDGFADITSCNYGNDNEHDISYTLAYKKVNGNEILLAVVLRGTDFVEWFGNMDIGRNTPRHESFQKADSALQEKINCYVKRNNLTNINFLITGHSRGAAVANLLAVDLNEKNYTLMPNLNRKGVKNVYAYTFATPNNMKSNYVKAYKNIFNFCFEDDFVPQVPLINKGWDYGKSGITHSRVAEYEYYDGTSKFNKMENLYIRLSQNREPSFNYEATKKAIKAFYNTANTVNGYNNTPLAMEPLHGYTKYAIIGIIRSLGYFHTAARLDILWDTEEDKTLHDFMRDYIAQAILDFCDNHNYISSAVIGTGLKLFPFGNDVNEIAAFFFYNMESIWDTHDAFTYYNALKTGVFIKPPAPYPFKPQPGPTPYPMPR